MSDKLVMSGTGRIVKEPAANEKGTLTLELVANLWQKSEDPKDNTHPLFMRCVLVAGNGLNKLFTSKIGNLKGKEVAFTGEFNFNTFARKDGTEGIGYTLFPYSLKVFEPNPPAAATVTTAAPETANDNPF